MNDTVGTTVLDIAVMDDTVGTTVLDIVVVVAKFSNPETLNAAWRNKPTVAFSQTTTIVEAIREY